MSAEAPAIPAAMPAKRPMSDRFIGVSPEQYLKQVRTQFMESERAPKLDRDRTMFKNDMVYRGKHRIYLSRSGNWEEIRNETVLFYPENYFRVLLDANTTQLTQAQVAFIARASVDSEEARVAARAVQCVADYYQRKLFTESFRHDLTKNAQLQGMAGVYGSWDSDDGPTLRTPRYEPEEYETPAAFVCGGEECGKQGLQEELVRPSDLVPPGVEMESGSLDDAPMCPECGSSELELVEPSSGIRGRQAGWVEYPAGDPAIEIVPGYEISVNSSARTTRTSGRTQFHNFYYLNRTRLMDYAAIERLHPGCHDDLHKVTFGSGMNLGSPALNYQQQIERTYGGADTDRLGWAAGDSRNAEYSETWLSLEAIGDEYRASKDFPLYEGSDKMMRAGQTFRDVFKRGVKLCMSGEKVLGCRDEDARKRWRFIKVRQMPGSFWGGDFSDALPLQFLLNEFNSLILSNAMNNELPRAMANSQVVKNLDTYASPGNLMTYEVLPEGIGADELFIQYPGQGLAASAYSYPQMVRTQMQSIFGGNFLGVSGESGGQKLDTARSWSIAQSQASAKSQTMFSLVAEGLAGVLEVVLDLFGEHANEERMIELQGDYAIEETMAVEGRLLGRDIEIRVKPGSVVPRQDWQLRDDIDGMLGATRMHVEAYGGPPKPKMARAIAERYNTPTSSSNAEEAARKAQIRMRIYEKMLKGAGQRVAEQMLAESQQMAAMLPPEDQQPAMEMLEEQIRAKSADPNVIADAVLAEANSPGSPVAIQIFGDYHEEMAGWYEDWLNADDGIKADPIEIAFVQRVIVAHYGAEAEKQATIQMKMQEAQMKAAMALQPAQNALAMGAMPAMPPGAQQNSEGPKGQSGRPRGASPNYGPGADAQRAGDAAANAREPEPPTGVNR